MPTNIKEPVGFYWREPSTGQFCVVLLDPTRKEKGRTWCEEFSADTVEALQALALDAGYELKGDVKELCEDAATWRFASRREKARHAD